MVQIRRIRDSILRFNIRNINVKVLVCNLDSSVWVGIGGNMRKRTKMVGHDVIGYDTNIDLFNVKNIKEFASKLDALWYVWQMIFADKVILSVKTPSASNSLKAS